MSFRKKQEEGLQANWWFVIIALVVGLCVPDKLNPMEMLFSKFKDDKKKEQKGSENQ